MRALAGTDDGPPPTPLDALESAEGCAWALLSSMTALPARYRVMLSCRFGLGSWRGLTQREASGMLGYSDTTRKHRTEKALHLLQERRVLFKGTRPRNGVNGPQGTPEESHDLVLAQQPLSTVEQSHGKSAANGGWDSWRECPQGPYRFRSIPSSNATSLRDIAASSARHAGGPTAIRR